jgi:hypothetical protein
LEQCGSRAPDRWLATLAEALPEAKESSFARCAEALQDNLPPPAWAAPDLTSLVLHTARASLAQARPASDMVGLATARRVVASLCLGPRRLFDPACGTAVFLLAAFERALKRRVEGGQETAAAALAVLSHEIAGVDTDAEAVAVVEFSLRLAAWRLAGLRDDAALLLHCADFLSDLPQLDRPCELLAGAPPSLEARDLPAGRRAALRSRFRGATGNFSLPALYVERGLEILASDGVVAFLLPTSCGVLDRSHPPWPLPAEQEIESLERLAAPEDECAACPGLLLRVRKKARPGAPLQAMTKAQRAGADALLLGLAASRRSSAARPGLR